VFAAAPPAARAIRPDIPPGLDAVLSRMMATDPAHRYQSAEAVMRALLPYLPASGARPAPWAGGDATPPPGLFGPTNGSARSVPAADPRPTADAAPSRVLIVDDQPDIR